MAASLSALDVTVDLLHDGQAGHHRRRLAACGVGVLGHLAREAVEHGLRQDCRCRGTRKKKNVAHRSISPNTMSRVPITGHGVGNHVAARHLVEAARCAKPGARILRR